MTNVFETTRTHNFYMISLSIVASFTTLGGGVSIFGF